MKDKSQFIGVVLIVCAIILMYKTSEQQRAAVVGQQISNSAPAKTDGTVVVSAEEADVVRQVAEEKESVIEKTFVIENDVVKVTLSNVGGAIKSVALKKYKESQDRDELVTFNGSNDVNALSLSFGKWDFSKFKKNKPFEIVSHNKNSIKFKRSSGVGYDIIREYSINNRDENGADGYIIKTSTYIENVSSNTINLGDMNVFIGAIPTIASDSRGDYLNFGIFDGKDDKFIKVGDFKASSGFLGIGKRQSHDYFNESGSYKWGAIKNQFFTAVLTSDIPADGYFASVTHLPNMTTGEQEECISGSMVFHIGELGPQSKFVLKFDFYVGSKNFARLSAMGSEQLRVMQFGFFGAISELLLRLINLIHSVIPNWGWSIIVLTTLVKLALWPLTNAQVKSSKKMASVQGPLKEIKEKYRNNPQKMQAETIKLFRENNINPASGCLPVLIQIPIFFGLYYMLRTSSDLRFAHFLWIRDLSLPDSIAHVMGLPVNILPMIMGATMFWQMHMTPMPTADNSQKIMFKIMPAIFLLCCYNLPSGLVLYWTVQNLLTIVQQSIVSRKQKAQLENGPTGEGESKSISNIRKSFIKKQRR